MWNGFGKWLSSVLTGVIITIASTFIAQQLGYIKISWPVKTAELPDARSVYTKASSILMNADYEVIVAVDFPSNGIVSVPDIYKTYYRPALEHAINDDHIVQKQFLWFKKDVEERIARDVEHMRDEDVKRVLSESNWIRDASNGHANNDVNSMLLGYLNYWVACNSWGNCESVIDFLDEPPSSRGFYTNSPEVAKILRGLAPIIARRMSIDKEYCSALYKEHATQAEPPPAQIAPLAQTQASQEPPDSSKTKPRRGKSVPQK